MGIFQSRHLEVVDPELEEAERLIEESGVVAAQTLVTEKLEGWKKVTIKIAVTGNAGVGKSTFINTLRELDHEDNGSAETDVIEVLHIEPEAYPYPGNPNITLVDLPGIGTSRHPDLKTYCETVDLESYDTFLIITATRFTIHELELAQKIESMGKSFFLIRSKIDIDETNDKRKRNHNKEEMMKKIQEYCHRSVNALKIPKDDIFLINNFEKKEWDFPRLVDAILEKLPTHQKEALTLSLRMRSKEGVKRKVEVLRNRTWMVMLLFIPAAAVDVVYKNFASHSINWVEVRRRMAEYRSYLGLPEEDSDAFRRMNENLQKEMKEFYAKQDGDFWNEYSKCVKDTPVVFTVKKAKETSSCLHHVLDEMQKMAFKVLDDAAAHNTEEVTQQ